MVLHNDKWKYRSRKDYMRKHGLKELKKDSVEKRKEQARQEKRDAGMSEEQIAAEEARLEEEKEHPEIVRQRKLGDNTWRFNEAVADDELEHDPEILEARRKQEEEEERVLREQAEQVKNHLKEQEKEREKERSSVEDKPARENSRTMTEEEKEMFLKQRREIEHKKMVDDAKGKRSEKLRALEIDREDDDNYRGLADRKLAFSSGNDGKSMLEDDMSELLGDMAIEDPETDDNQAETFDLDSAILQASSEDKKKESQRQYRLQPEADDDFLEDLLG